MYREFELDGKHITVKLLNEMNAYLKQVATTCNLKNRLSTYCISHTFITSVKLANMLGNILNLIRN